MATLRALALLLNGVLLLAFGRAWWLATAPSENWDYLLAALATGAPLVNSAALILDARRR